MTLTTPAARAIWEHLVQWQPATAADLTQHLRAMPDDWPLRVFDVGRPDAALTLPPGAEGEQYPDRAPEIAPYDDIAAHEDCPACAEAGDNCRFHTGYAAGHREANQPLHDALKARPDMTLREFAAWSAQVTEAQEYGIEPSALPAAPSTPADTAERSERYAVAIHDAMESDLSLTDQEPRIQALFACAAEAAVTVADREQAGLRAELDAATRQIDARRQELLRVNERNADEMTRFRAIEAAHTSLVHRAHDMNDDHLIDAIARANRETADEAQQQTEDLAEFHREGAELVCVDMCGSCDACGMEPFGTPAEGWREAARFLRRTPRDSADFLSAIRGARLIETELRRLADEAQQTEAAR
ncbi:hypothetical protein ACFQ0X_43835 [Streptomyces rectiviolaceus]|uniref:Uncharacterized protein n=1 Tax=Streptomyces rectiviolaceus TaxID=332591 RepID=A0ABP6MH05_9ACTN